MAGITCTAAPIGYDAMGVDVLALMDTLHVGRAALVGWSDGAIIGLDIAIHHPERLTRLFAFAANSDPSGVKDVDKSSAFTAYISRAAGEDAKFSPTPTQFKAFLDDISRMAASVLAFYRGRAAWHHGADVDCRCGSRRSHQTREHRLHGDPLIPGCRDEILPGVSDFRIFAGSRRCSMRRCCAFSGVIISPGTVNNDATTLLGERPCACPVHLA